MSKVVLTGVRGNLGRKCAEALLELRPIEDLVFTSSSTEGLQTFADVGVEVRAANFNDPERLPQAFEGADTVVIISMPFVGERRRAAHKAAIDAAVAVGAKRIIYTSSVGAGETEIDAYEINDHVWTEGYLQSQPVHYLILRNSQYAEAMVASFLHSYEHDGGVLTNNSGEGRMALISRDDCALALAHAAASELQDQVLEINGAQLLSTAEFCEIGSAVTGKGVAYRAIDDDAMYEYFDSVGVPRTTEEMWADTAKAFPFCSDGMVTYGRALRKGQMSTFTDDFEALVGRKPLTVREIFEDLEHHGIGGRTVTE